MEKERLVQLVSDAQMGKNEAKTRLYNEFNEKLYYYIYKTVNDRELAADLTQDTFIEIYQTLDSLKEPAAFENWSYKIAYHRCTAYFRKKRELLADENEDGFSVLDTAIEEREEFIPDEALDKEELKKAIREMIDALPEEQRSAIMMRYFNEIPVKEIADIQGVSEGTVKSRLSYGRKAIQQSVEEYEKKNGVKLHCAGVIPMLLWFFRDYRIANAMSLTEGMARVESSCAEQGAAAGTAAKSELGSVIVKEGAQKATKYLAVKIAAVVAVVSLIAGIAVGILKKDEPENNNQTGKEQAEVGETAGIESIEGMLDYDYLEDVLCFLPEFSKEEPVSEYYFYHILAMGAMRLYDHETVDNPEMYPTYLRSEDLMEIVTDSEEGGLWSYYIRVKGDAFDEVAELIGYDSFDAESYFTELEESDEYSYWDWDNGTVKIVVEGTGTGWTTGCEITNTYYEGEQYFVDYTLTGEDYLEGPSQSEWTAVLELVDDGYRIVQIMER